MPLLSKPPRRRARGFRGGSYHAKNKVLRDQLDQLFERIEAVLSKYTDADF
jgi:hypothetical protein